MSEQDMTKKMVQVGTKLADAQCLLVAAVAAYARGDMRVTLKDVSLVKEHIYEALEWVIAVRDGLVEKLEKQP